MGFPYSAVHTENWRQPAEKKENEEHDQRRGTIRRHSRRVKGTESCLPWDPQCPGLSLVLEYELCLSEL